MNSERLFRAGIAVVAVAVVDDRFVQPQAGTGAVDHLVSGLVPLALLVLATWRFTNARPSRRAGLAVAAGLFGVVVGASEAVYSASNAGPTGDDYTGFLALVAGVALVVAGLAGLWRARRVNGSWPWRIARRILIAIGVLVVSVPITAAYVYAHSAKSGVAGADLTIASQPVRFDSAGGVSLAGRWIPSKNGAAVIAYPGRKEQVEMLARAGYGVLLFTRQGEGESDGDPQRWTLADDIRGAVAFARSRPGVEDDRVGGIGFSVGGESMLQAASETTQIRAVVSEGAGVRTAKESVHLSGATKWFGVAGDAVYMAASAVFSDQTPPSDLLDDAARIGDRPVFLIYTSGKGLGGEDLNPQYHAALTGPSEIWDIPEASHTGGIRVRPAEYRRRVVGFFDRTLLAGFKPVSEDDEVVVQAVAGSSPVAHP